MKNYRLDACERPSAPAATKTARAAAEAEAKAARATAAATETEASESKKTVLSANDVANEAKDCSCGIEESQTNTKDIENKKEPDIYEINRTESESDLDPIHVKRY